MRKSTLVLSAATLLASVALAFAAEDSGKVIAIDAPSRTLTFEDGTQYRLSDNVMIQLLKPGQEVTVSYEEKDGQRVADKVKIEE